jgi:ribose transport system substrate-binding protein
LAAVHGKSPDKVAGKAKVVAVDALPAELNYVRSGQVEVLLGVYEWGTSRCASDGQARRRHGARIRSSAELTVTMKNADEWKNWDKWLGKSRK